MDCSLFRFAGQILPALTQKQRFMSTISEPDRLGGSDREGRSLANGKIELIPDVGSVKISSASRQLQSERLIEGGKHETRCARRGGDVICNSNAR